MNNNRRAKHIIIVSDELLTVYLTRVIVNA